MPYSRMLRLGLACLAASIMLLAPAAAAAAVRVNVRVLDTDGRVLADQRQFTGTVSVKTDPGADCFGSGTGGSGNTVAVPGPTALGVVWDAAQFAHNLRPVSLTDSFSFGLGICGFGTARATGSASWYLKVDHVGAQVGGDQFRIKTGDDVLWYLAPSFPYPDELGLRAPGRAEAGKPFTVRVTAFDDSGKETPVAGATVTGAALPTGADGATSVQIENPKRIQPLYASHGSDIPGSARLCVGQSLGDCPKRSGERIAGTRKADRIKGTRGPDRVLAGPGRDKVNVRGGSRDRVDCGRGRDRVVLGRGDTEKRCERVRRP